MCLIAFAWRSHPAWELVVAANRDEFHGRATEPAAYWADAPSVYAGRDLEAGGSWCGVDRHGRFAAVTNVREPATPEPGACSRGALVADYLRGALSAREYCTGLWPQRGAYGGFNLLVGDGEDLFCLGNRDDRGVLGIPPGIHALSNGILGDDWPKTERAQRGLRAALSGPEVDVDVLLAMLADETPAAAGQLPDTGVGSELELALSPVFIRGQSYGTRASTVILRGADGGLRMVERGYGPGGRISHEIDCEIT
ncbi:MAG: NRDE family protein [Salinisphaera sp.]|nr:NRDE family protein [Salinisphaera sp.]